MFEPFPVFQSGCRMHVDLKNWTCMACLLGDEVMPCHDIAVYSKNWCMFLPYCVRTINRSNHMCTRTPYSDYCGYNCMPII